MIRLACAILLCVSFHGRPQMIETEYVSIIDHNRVLSRTKPKTVRYEQFVFYRVHGSRVECVGYLMLRPDTNYDLKRMPGDRWELNFATRGCTWRRIVGSDLHKSETTHDPEMIERQSGERNALFDLKPWGDVAG